LERAKEARCCVLYIRGVEKKEDIKERIQNEEERKGKKNSEGTSES